MKKIFLLLLIFSGVESGSAQVNYCLTSRFDTEIFQNIVTTSNVTFGSSISSSGAPTTLTLDVYEPANDTMTKRPLIVWVHGGSFVGGTKNDADVTSLCEHFAKRGYVCASINYRLGFANYPPTKANAEQAVLMAVQDMKAAIRFFRKDAATTNTFHIDPVVIFGGGSSAGAFTALHLAYLDQPSEIPADIDTNLIGGMEGNSGNPGFPSTINAVIDLCGALGHKEYIQPGDIPFCAMHGNMDGTVPYATATIYLLGLFPVMDVDGSYSIAHYADSIGVPNVMYTFYGADHVPYLSNTSYMDTTVRFVSNFLYRYFGCTPTDPTPLPNTFTTGVPVVIMDDNIQISPNPSADKFNIYLEKNADVFSVYDLRGRKLISMNNPGHEFLIDMSVFSPGIYFYKMEGENKLLTGKLIKE